MTPPQHPVRRYPVTMIDSVNTRSRSVDQQEANTLGEVGAELRKQDIPRISVRIPQALAERALRAWKREADDGGTVEVESLVERTTRHRAGTLALIGLAIDERGQQDGDAIRVDVHPEQIGIALDAADDL